MRRCDGLRDADRRVRLLMPPHHLVVSLIRFMSKRRTGAQRKLLAAVSLTERPKVPLADWPTAQYRLYAVIVHASHSLDSDHYFSFCRASGGGVSDDGGWWRLDDAAATPVTATTSLSRPHRSTKTAYTLLRRLAGAADEGRPPALAALPGALRAAVEHNAVYRRERRGRPTTALPLVADDRPRRPEPVPRADAAATTPDPASSADGGGGPLSVCRCTALVCWTDNRAGRKR